MSIISVREFRYQSFLDGFFSADRFEFNELFERFDYPSIRDQILTRRMTTSPFTTVLWRIFLHCLPRDSDQWEKTINLSRENYEDLADKYYVDEKKVREIKNVDDQNHPLSQEDRVRIDE